MTAVLDTNVLVRHLSGEPAHQARRATSFLETQRDLLLTSVVLAVVFVLESNYERSREDIVVAGLSLLALPSILAPEADALIEALRLYQRVRIHFVDAYRAAVARETGSGRVASFDKRLDRVDGVERVEP